MSRARGLLDFNDRFGNFCRYRFLFSNPVLGLVPFLIPVSGMPAAKAQLLTPWVVSPCEYGIGKQNVDTNKRFLSVRQPRINSQSNV